MKRKLTLLIAFLAILPWFVLWWDVVVNNVSSMNTQCNSAESKTYWFYLTESMQRNPYDNFINTSANSYITKHDSTRTGTSVDVWKHWNVISNCTNWSRTSTAVKKSETRMIIQNQDGCMLNIPTYTKVNNPNAVDAQIHYNIWFVQFNYWSNQITDRLYYTNYGNNYVTCFENWNQVSNWSSCPTSNITYSKEYFHVWECINYKVFWCWDGLVNSETWTTYNNWSHVEQCDPNDPDHTNWGNGWCSDTCQPINIQNPQCNSTYNWHTQYTPNANPWLNNTMNLCTIWTLSNFTSTWTTWHARHFNWKCSAGGNTVNCTAYQNWCWNGRIDSGSNEQCDPNDPDHTNWGNGWCSDSCQPIIIENPECNSTYNGHTQYTPNSNPWLNNTMNLCSIWTISNFNYSWTPRVFTWNCVTGWNTANCSANQQWCWDSQLNGNEQCDYNDPNHVWWNGMECDKSCHLHNPGSPVPYLLKEQKTWGMSNFTTNQINVEIWDIITYKVNFKNSWTVAATWKVWDILPPCTNYLTSSIVLPSWITYNWPLIWTYWNQDTVQYKDFLLQAGQGWYMLVQAQVRWTGTNWTTSCSNVMSYLNTWYFSLSWITLQSQVIAVRPGTPNLVINKELITAWDMTAGSTVVYKITLRNNGNATYHNAYILDILPNAIEYGTSSIQNVTNYLFEEWTTWNNEYYIKYYNFDLAAGHTAIVYLTWTLKEWFNFNQTTNCAFTQGWSGCVLFPLTPIPYVKKWQKVWNMDYTDETIEVQLWDTIRYKVDFANLWNRAATGQVKDVLPPCVKYVSSSIHWVNPYQWPITGHQWVQDVVLYKNFPLAAWQTWYMLVEAEIVESWILGVNCSDTRSYLNTWYFRFTDGIRLSDDVLAIREESAGSEVIFDKTWNKKLMHPGEGGLEFYITVTNNWPDPISNIYVEDIRPNRDCIVYEWRTGDESLIEYVSYLRWHYIWVQGAKTNYNIPWEPSSTHPKGTLYAWQSFNFTIFASVKNDPSCVWYYINKAILTYTEWGETHTLEDDYDFEVIDDNPDYACESITSSGSIVELGTNNQWHMRFTCTASDSNPHTIYIDCGNWRWDTWYNTSSFTYNCTYWANDEWLSLAASCIVDWEEPTSPACIKKIWINPGLYWDCGNGIIEAWEDCDLASARWVSVIITDYLDAAWTIRAGQFEWNYCKNCKMITGNNFVYEPAECLYSDTPISVMDEEIMPFWWRLWLKDSQVVGDNGCYQDSAYATREKSSSSTSSSLSPWDKWTLLKKSSMYCTFSIYNWTNKLQWDSAVTTFRLPCFEWQSAFTSLAIYKYFRDHHQTNNLNWWASYATINMLLWWLQNNKKITTYWEYKLVLEKVEYEYCDKTTGKWKPGKRYWAVCEVDFAITKPYMMQVSTFGVNPVWTNWASFLDDYYDMNWKKIIDSTDLKETINTDNTDYAVSSDAKAQMNAFKEKYGKLAVNINKNTVTSLWLNQNEITSVSKVPNQSIYFIKWSWKLTLSQKNLNKNKTSAYTLVVEWMDVEIEWDVFIYAMIVTDWKISFKDWWDSKYRCQEWWQVVQWIFVALKWFETWPSLKNTSANEERCARWGLHVKWVLIWKNIENLISNRRSQLNSWFNVDSVGWSAQKVRTERKKKIMEWAALLIEYSPELWKSLPPWADIFTESLEVYRK